MNWRLIWLLIISLTLHPVSAMGTTGQGAPIGAPDPVTSVSAALINQTPDPSTDIRVTWVAGANDGGSTITGYSVVSLTGADYTTQGPGCTAAGATATTCDVIGLAFNTSYKFSVIATNSVGSSTAVVSEAISTPFQSQTVTITNSPGDKTFGDAAFQVTATATSGLPVTWSTSTSSICSIDNVGFISILAAGTCTFTATQSGAGTPYASASATDSFDISAAVSATIGSATNVQATTATLSANVPFGGSNISVQFCVVATNSTTSCTAPAGVSVSTASPATITSTSGSNTSANVSGLTRGDTYFFFVIATSGATEVKTETNTFTTPINPTLTLSGPTNGQVNQAFSTTVTASSGSGIYPTWGATSLPNGLSLIPQGTQATISGTPITAGTSSATIQVTDSLGQSASLIVEFSFAAPPAPSGGGGGGGGGGIIDTTKDDQPSTSDVTGDAGSSGDVNPGGGSTGPGSTAPVTTPAGTLPNQNPGTSSGTIDGQSAPVTQNIRNSETVRLQIGGVSVEFTGKDQGSNSKLQQQVLNLFVGDFILIEGTGYDPNSGITAWLFSQPLKIATLTVNANGAFSAQVRIPQQAVSGNHTVQVVGSKENKAVALSLGVILKKRDSATKTFANAVYFKAGVKLDAAELKKVAKYRAGIKPRATFTCIGYTRSAKPTATERKLATDRARNLCAAASAKLRPAKIRIQVKALSTAPPAKRSSNKQKIQRADLRFTNPR